MRSHRWAFKVITTYADGMTSAIYLNDYSGVIRYKRGVLDTEIVKFTTFPYGGVID